MELELAYLRKTNACHTTPGVAFCTCSLVLFLLLARFDRPSVAFRAAILTAKVVVVSETRMRNQPSKWLHSVA